MRNYQRELCEKHGISGRWRISPDPRRALVKKLFEEAAEFAESMDPDELYDVGDVLAELQFIFDPDGIHEAKHAEKIARNGNFSDYLEWNPVPEGPPLDPVSGNALPEDVR